MTKIKCFVLANAKAIAGFIAAAGVYIGTRIGTPLPDGAELAIGAFVASFIVWLIPNKECAPAP